MASLAATPLPVSHEHVDAAIVGAGPYGLAVTAFLRGTGIEPAVFGEPMKFWRTAMPAGMFLRSPWSASMIGDPRNRLTLDRFQAERGTPIPRPIPLTDFVDYAAWFAAEVLPNRDPRSVSAVERNGDGFRVVLDDGDVLHAKRVVVAAGLRAFANWPSELDSARSTRISHAADGVDVTAFSGRRVLVVGGGQTALETAALLAENGADVEVVLRAPAPHWLVRRTRLRQSRLGPLAFAPSDVGPPGLSWVVHYPGAVRLFPQSTRDWMMSRSSGPAVAVWLMERAEAVRVTPARRIADVEETPNALQVTLDDGSVREVDHLLLGTGYRPDVRRYPFLSAALLRELDLVEGLPRLNARFESSVPGLHFVGASATHSFGPLMRFVAGTRMAARAVARAFR